MISMTLVAPPQEQQRPSKASPRMRRKRAPATPRTTEKPIRNASTNTTPPPYHSRACKAQPCHSLRASRISSAQPRMIGISGPTPQCPAISSAPMHSRKKSQIICILFANNLTSSYSFVIICKLYRAVKYVSNCWVFAQIIANYLFKLSRSCK